jgi:hypothetical protein
MPRPELRADIRRRKFVTLRGSAQGESCSGVNDYLRVKFFAAVVELARPSRLDVAIVLGPDLQSSLGDQLEVGQGLPIATDSNRYYQRADRGHYGRVLRRPIFEFIKCICFVGHDATAKSGATVAGEFEIYPGIHSTRFNTPPCRSLLTVLDWASAIGPCPTCRKTQSMSLSGVKQT